MTNNPLKDEPIKPKADSTGEQDHVATHDEDGEPRDPSPVETVDYETDEDDLPF